jgi:hypothetical protein
MAARPWARLHCCSLLRTLHSHKVTLVRIDPKLSKTSEMMFSPRRRRAAGLRVGPRRAAAGRGPRARRQGERARAVAARASRVLAGRYDQSPARLHQPFCLCLAPGLLLIQRLFPGIRIPSGSDWLSSHASQARTSEPGSAHANAHHLIACVYVGWPSMKLIGCLGA